MDKQSCCCVCGGPLEEWQVSLAIEFHVDPPQACSQVCKQERRRLVKEYWEANKDKSWHDLGAL